MPQFILLIIIFITAASASSNASKHADDMKKKEYVEKTYHLNVLHPVNKEPWIIEHDTKIIKQDIEVVNEK